MDKLKPCPNCENLKHPDFPCIRCYPLNPVFVRRPASNTNTDTALAAAEARIAELEKALEPFADLSGQFVNVDMAGFHEAMRDNETRLVVVRAGDARRAAALLKEKE